MPLSWPDGTLRAEPMRFARFCPPTALAVGLLLPAPARAQTNVEPLRAKLASKPLAAIVEGNLSGQAGNVQGVVAGASAQLGAASGRHFGFVYGKTDFARFAGKTTISRSFAHGRYNYQLTPRLWWELFGQVQNDLFQRLRVRNLWGTGPRYALYEGASFHTFVGVAYMFEYEAIDPKLASFDPATTTAQRLSSYVSISYAHGTAMTAGLTTYLQPRLDEPSDARVLVEGATTFAITPRLSSKVTATLRYDSDPPTSVRTADLEVKNSLSLAF
jgi:hypothetical protein